ncbi:glycosyltransferase family 2 protein [Myroides sp. TSA_177.3]|uniref:glycosyltransferase family 2 protein n=1 Tax=Myroides sp. TSA_177.3 TaxID=3415650 RepID=UPI0040466FAD
MKVSVVIPFYSNIKWLEEAVESVLSQTFKDFEIIVINDGSLEDDSLFIKQYGDKIRYHKIKNGGPAKARNIGIDMAQGEYIAFLDSDDIWLSMKLEKQITLMDNEQFIWCHSKYSVFQEVIDKHEREYTIIDNSKFKGNVYPKSLKRLHIATPCVIIRRDYLVENPLIRFATNMRYGQDGYCWILISRCEKLGYCDDVLTYVRRLGTNAVQRAQVHLNVRSNLYKNLIMNKVLEPNFSISIVYKYCYLGDKLVSFFSKKISLGRNMQELLSKIIYFPAYLFFKLS